MHRRGRSAIALAAATAVALATVAVGPRYLRAAALVVDASNIDGWPHQVAGWRAVAFRTEERRLPSRHGGLNARLYIPEGRPRRALLLVPGRRAFD